MNGDRGFKYVDMHKEFMLRNNKVIILSRILISYSFIALALTCFGLFGISWYAVRHRTREIAIRKVHGASNLGNSMVTKPFVSMANTSSIHHRYSDNVVINATLAGAICLSNFSHTMEFPDPCSYCIGNYNHYDNNT